MTEYTKIVVNVVTGEKSIVPLTEEEIAAIPNVTPEIVVPYSVSPRQVRLLLLQQNLLEDVETMILAQPKEIQIAWEYALEFRRDDPLLNTLAANLNLTEQQLDEFFIAASNL
jgi:hypothetical protein